jgi:hypothetical protein
MMATRSLIGRPTKLTPAVQQRLVQAVADGNYREAACAYAGIGWSTFSRWMQRGEAARSGPFRELWEAIQEAEAEAEFRVVGQWQQQIPENWQAARDFLARRYPERWGPKERREVTGKDGGPLEQHVQVSGESVIEVRAVDYRQATAVLRPALSEPDQEPAVREALE